MEEDDIEQKQNYLRSEIIDKGFNPEDFMNFLEHFKTNSLLRTTTRKFHLLKILKKPAHSTSFKIILIITLTMKSKKKYTISKYPQGLNQNILTIIRVLRSLQ